MKIKQTKLNFTLPNGSSTRNPDNIGRNSINNNLSAPYPEHVKRGSDDSQSSVFGITQRTKKKSFFKTYGYLPVWFAILLFLAAIVVPCVLLFTMYVSNTLIFPYGDCVLLEEYRTPCTTAYSKVGQRECEEVKCCWDSKAKECYHSIPARHGYLWSSSQGFTKVVQSMDLDLSARLSRTPLLTSSYPRLRASLRFVSRSHLRIIIGTPKSTLVTSVQPSNTNDSDLEVYMASPAFAFEVYRKDNDSRVALISSTRSPLVASVNYWEIGLRCPPQGAAFGLGGLEPSNTTLLYSSSSRSASFPYFMCLGPDGKAHGIMIRNSGPVEVSFVKKSKLFILRALSNSGWDINILSGPKPGDVVNQLTEIVGRPKLPPYWVLGFHVCRDFSDGMNSTNLNTTVIMDEFLTFFNSSISQGLPYDSDCIHERLLNHLNFTASADVISQFSAAFDSLHTNGKKFLLSLPPQVSEGDGGSFIRKVNGSLYEGEYRDRKVFYPDFTNPNASRWMASRLQILSSAAANVSSVLAGFVLTDNWPEDVSLHDTERLPYLPAAINGSLSDNTVYWSANHWNNKKHYEIHNIYGLQQSESLRNATDVENPVIMSSSCSFGSLACLNQRHISPNASWASLKEAVVSVLGNGLAGVPLAGGGPVCGAEGEVPENVCLRWYMLGVVLPIMRVSSTQPLRDPAHATSSQMARVVLAALRLRYSLLPYYYTLLHDASRTGAPLLRPMFYEFPHDPATWSLDEQFMVGPALLAAPGIRSNAPVVHVYLPAGDDTWFVLDGGLPVNHGSGNVTVSLASGEAQLVLLLRAGHVLPTQMPGADTQTSRQGSYKLAVALHCDKDDSDNCSATGHMVLEENVTVTFSANSTAITIGNLHEVCSVVKLQPLTDVTVSRPAKRPGEKSTTYQATRSTQFPSVTNNAFENSTTAGGTPEKSTGNSVSSTTATARVETSSPHSTASETTHANSITTVSSLSSTSEITSTVAGGASSSTVSSTGITTKTNETTTVSPQTTASSETSFTPTPSLTTLPLTNTSGTPSMGTTSTQKSGARENPTSSKSDNISQQITRERKKRQIIFSAKSSKANKVIQPLIYKLTNTSLCTGENSIVINYV